MKALDRAMLRDLWRLRGQVAALGLVVAAGAGVFVALQSTIDTIVGARDAYFAAQRMADVFVTLKRAPRAVLDELAALPGVAEIEGRVVELAPVFVAGRAEPAQVQLVSLDPGKPAPLDAVRVRRGRLPDPERDDEVVLNEPFAQAARLAPGDEVEAILDGRLRTLLVVGIGISPEFVFQLPAGTVALDDARYGVAWMQRRPLEAAFDLRGAFDDAVIRLAPGADGAAVIAAVDRRLAPYGGRGAYGRSEQYSSKSLDSRIARLHAMLVVLPALFLAVAAFVLNVVLGRVVQTQRQQIGTLKAFGYGNPRLARHYLVLATLAVAPGAALGVAGGIELGDGMIATLVRYFRLPLDRREVSWGTLGWALAVVLAAGLLGALRAALDVARLDPVEAMRAPVPPPPRRTALSSLEMVRRLPAAALLVVRNLRMAPLRAGASILALAFAAALFVSGAFLGDSLDALMAHQFGSAMREDLTVAFKDPVDPAACTSLRALGAVAACEPLESTPVRAEFGPRSERVSVTAPTEGGTLRRVVDTTGGVVPVPPAGLLAGRRLLARLGASVGDALTLQTLEGRPVRRAIPVVASVDDELGLNLYASRDTVQRLTLGMPTMSTALLRLGPGDDLGLIRRLDRLPVVVGTTSRLEAVRAFETTTTASLRAIIIVLAVLSAALAVAVVYNGARVGLAERARDLATLRILGFTRAEVARILFGEMGIELAAGVPLGLMLGRALAGGIARAMASDEFRLPLVISARTYLLAAAVVLGASVLSALHVRRLVDRLDLVETLKTRE